MARRGWLEQARPGDGRRGRDAFVPVSWETALALVAEELERVREGHGSAAI
jgi:biotin/methionine sulfoxide reductase